MTDAFKDKVAIIGMGCTKFGENWDKSLDDMIVEATYEAYEDAGIEPDVIEAGWIGTVYSAYSGTLMSDPLKLDGRPITRVENQCASPLDALRNACFAVASGMYKVVLVVGAEKLKDTGFSGTPLHEFSTNFGITAATWSAPASFALPAMRYFEKYGATKEHLAKIAVKNHRNGARRPKAHFQREVTMEQVMNAPIIAWPLGLFDCCPTTDGVAAAIICRKELAKNFRKDYVNIRAMGLALDAGLHIFRPNFDYLGWPATVNAARMAYDIAGIKEPFKEIDLAEVHDCFTMTELLTYEDLGFCPRGEAKDYIDSGVFSAEGELPVNIDGGLKSFGHPIGASGLRMVYEIYKQLQGKAGANQLKNPEVGLAHNIGGLPQVGCVAILTI